MLEFRHLHCEYTELHAPSPVNLDALLALHNSLFKGRLGYIQEQLHVVYKLLAWLHAFNVRNKHYCLVQTLGCHATVTSDGNADMMTLHGDRACKL